MSALPVEIIEPDPAATSLSNDETVNKEGGDQSAPTEKNVEMTNAKLEEVKETNGSAEVKAPESSEKVEEKSAEKAEEKTEAAAVKDEKSEKQNGHKRGDFKKEFNNNRGPPRNHNKGPNNSKYDPTVLESTDDHKQIRAQVEFYFGDANLPTDQFMWELTDGASNKPVPIETICKFGRMKRFNPVSAVVEALKQSQVLVVSGEVGEETVKRKIAYDPTASRSGILGRSVYVKGFGDEVRSSQFDIEAFFAKYGTTNAVRLRRTNDKEFKGSVFVEFADVETAEKFLAMEPKPEWKKGEALEIKSKREYTEGKALDIKEGRMEPSESYAPFRSGRGGRGDQPGDRRGRGRGGRGGNNFRGGDRDRGGRGGRGGGDRRDRGDRAERGDRDPDDWKKRREDDRASGFKGDKKNDRRGGRGGRGGNRGGRNDRNEERENGNAKKEENSDKAVKEEKSENVENSAANEKKRSREDDAGSEQPAKKVDTKPEPTAATS